MGRAGKALFVLVVALCGAAAVCTSPGERAGRVATAGTPPVPAPAAPPAAPVTTAGAPRALEPMAPLPPRLPPAPLPPLPKMAALQASPLALNASEIERLQHNAFVISERKHFPSFAEGWLAIYKADLPLYVSADALLHVLHRSYDAILKDTEVSVLVPRLEGALLGMRQHLAGSEGAGLTARTRADADFFTGVALGLLRGAPVAPAAGADPGEMAQWVSDVTAASGMSSRSVFGSPRDVDFSQFKPRGHYEDPPEGSPEARATARPLSRYFRSVMWLGRIDARITVPGRSGAPELRRRELELACGLRALMGPAEMTAWRQLEAAMNAFVGERDAMGPADVDRFYGDLGIAGYSHLPEVSDAKVLETLARGKYGYQRIASHPLAGGLEHTAPLPSSFSFTGERYIVDSHVLSDVVYDRVIPPPGKTPRMMPSPLDVAFAVFGNDVAGALLKPELETFGYGPNLQDARRHVEDGGAGLWDTSLYNLWMGALRTLSSRPTGRLPAVATTEAWDRRLLTSQLASWAELRHDTILYAKQSYSAMALCSFPDAYVEPYPALYGRFERFAARGKSLLDALDFSGATYVRDRAGQFFAQLGKVAQQLGHIAAAQQRGERPSREDLAWVNQALVEDPPSGGGCGASPRTVHGWYVDLFYDGNVLAFKPTIADVHTQPTDAAGNVVGRVLHVATGAPRLMVVNVDGARSFVGVVSDYSEVVTSGFQRLTDEEWRTRIQRGNAEDVPWMREIVAR